MLQDGQNPTDRGGMAGAPPARLSDEALRAELGRARQHLGDLLASRSPAGSVIDGLVENLVDGLALVSPDGHLLDVNTALCAMTGYSRDELVGVGMPYPFWPQEERERLQDAMRHHLAGQAASAEAILARKGGERFPGLITPSSLRDEHGPPFYVFAGIRDISGDRRAAHALRESEQRYRSIYDNAPIAIFEATLQGRLIGANRSFATLLGYTSVGELIDVVNRGGIAEILFDDPDQRDQLLEAAHAAAGEWASLEGRFRCTDGSLLTGLVSLREQADSTTGELHLFGFAQDVTAERKASEALERSTQLLSNGEHLAHLGSWAWDIARGALAASSASASATRT
jgi:PAS domain S-box-containing protein